MLGPTRYDSAVLKNLADKMYVQAASAVATSTGLGLLVGVVAGGAYGWPLREEVLDLFMWAAIGGVPLGAVGYMRGSARALSLRAEAQKILCQVEIEENTRRD